MTVGQEMTSADSEPCSVERRTIRSPGHDYAHRRGKRRQFSCKFPVNSDRVAGKCIVCIQPATRFLLFLRLIDKLLQGIFVSLVKSSSI